MKLWGKKAGCSRTLVPLTVIVIDLFFFFVPGDNADPVSCHCYVISLCAPFLLFKLYIIFRCLKHFLYLVQLEDP